MLFGNLKNACFTNSFPVHFSVDQAGQPDPPAPIFFPAADDKPVYFFKWPYQAQKLA